MFPAKSKTPHSGSKYKYTNTLQEIQPIVPESILFVEDVCQIVSELFPDLWKLGQAYFTGELQVKVESRKHVEFKHIVLTIMDSFSKLLRASIVPHTISKTGSVWSSLDAITEWLPGCLRQLRATYLILIRLDLPSDALDIVLKVIVDLKIHCIAVMFSAKIEEVKQLQKQETWKIEFSGTHNGITSLVSLVKVLNHFCPNLFTG